MEEVEYREEWHDKVDAPLIFNAIEFSVSAHRGQFRKGLKVPYVYHPMDVGRILMDLGCPVEVTEPEEIKTWEDRKNHTIEHLKTVSEEALFVIMADKFDNIRSIRLDMEKMGTLLWESFSRPEEIQRWYYESIAEMMALRIKEGPLHSLFERYKREMGRVFTPSPAKQ